MATYTIEPTVDISFEVMTNLLGLIMFKCGKCGSVMDSEDADSHAVDLHQATHMSILSIPILKSTEDAEENKES